MMTEKSAFVLKNFALDLQYAKCCIIFANGIVFSKGKANLPETIPYAKMNDTQLS